MNRHPDSGRKSVPARKVFTRKRRTPSPWREGLLALLNAAAGVGLLTALLQLPARLDSLLIVSRVISTLIDGLSRIGQGLLTLAAGLLQMLGILLLVGLAIAALLLLANGVFRLLRMAVPGLGGLLRLPGGLARVVWAVVRIQPPDRPER